MSVLVDRLRIRNPKIFKKCGKCGEKATDCGCRQGRNHASRRISRISSQNMANHLRSGGAVAYLCPNCEGSEVDLDYTTGDTICTFCGFVLDSGGMLSYGWATFGSSSSKEYETLVYIREKLRSLNGTGKPSLAQLAERWIVAPKVMCSNHIGGKTNLIFFLS